MAGVQLSWPTDCDTTLPKLSGDPALADPMEAVRRHRELHALHERLPSATPDGPVDPTALHAPVPTPSKVFAIGLNYRSHASETAIEPAPGAAHVHEISELLVRDRRPTSHSHATTSTGKSNSSSSSAIAAAMLPTTKHGITSQG